MLSFGSPKVILGQELFLVLSTGKRSEMHNLLIILACPCTGNMHLTWVMLAVGSLNHYSCLRARVKRVLIVIYIFIDKLI